LPQWAEYYRSLERLVVEEENQDQEEFLCARA
jgi:hypothetical protein